MSDSKISNSTEKLLSTIRGEASQPIENSSMPHKSSAQATSLRGNIKHSLCTGVFFENKFISFVLTGERKKGAGKELVKWSRIQIPDHLDIDSTRFPLFLKSSISEFLGGYKKTSIWTSIDSKDLKLRNITIPDIHDSKVSNAALWGLKKEVDFNVEKEIFDFDYIGDLQVSGIKKKNIVAFAGDKKQIEFLKHLFSTAGYPLKGITAMPFALQNFILNGSIQVESAPVVMVNVAKDHSEISCLSRNSVLLIRNIRTGSESLVEELTDADTPKNTDKTNILSSELQQSDPEFKLMMPAMDRLVGKIIRTGDYCSNNFAANEPIAKFLFFGETDGCKAFMDYAGERISSKIERFLPFEAYASSLVNKVALDAKQRTGVISALGIALSEDEDTPNFLYTYLQKNIKTKYRKMNWKVVTTGLFCLMICAGLWGWMQTKKNNEINQRIAIERQLSQYTPTVTQQLLVRKITEAKKKSARLNQYARDYLSLAIISEICSLTPEKISITSFDSDFTITEPKTDKTSREKKRSLILKGVVTDKFTELESTLTGYIVKLSDSPLFGDIQLQDKEIEKKENSTILIFTADMEIF